MTANKQAIDAAVEWAKKIAADNTYGYKKYGTTDHACHICHPNSSKGFNCIGLVCAAYAHGAGDKRMLKNCKKNNGAGLGNNATLNKNIEENWHRKNGPDWKYITNKGKLGGKKISRARLKKGDVLICYDKNGKYKHIAFYIGGGKIIDAVNREGKANDIKIRKYSDLSSRATRAFRYTGTGKF